MARKRINLKGFYGSKAQTYVDFLMDNELVIEAGKLASLADSLRDSDDMAESVEAEAKELAVYAPKVDFGEAADLLLSLVDSGMLEVPATPAQEEAQAPEKATAEDVAAAKANPGDMILADMLIDAITPGIRAEIEAAAPGTEFTDEEIRAIAAIVDATEEEGGE